MPITNNNLINKICLLLSNFFNFNGMWTYFYILVVYLYSIGGGVREMSLLTVSYTLPGLFMPTIARRILIKYQMSLTLSICMIIRMLSIISIMVTNNIMLMLLFVFIEQCFSTIYMMGYDVAVSYVSEKDEGMAKINSITNSISGVLKVMSVPVCLCITEISNIKFVFLYVAISYILSSIFIMRFQLRDIKLDSNNDFKHRKGALRLEREIIALILMFTMIAILRVLYETFALMIIPISSRDAVYPMMTTFYNIGMIAASFLSYIIIKFISIKDKHVMVMGYICLLSFSSLLLVDNKSFTFLSVMILSLVIVTVELIMKQKIQSQKNSVLVTKSFSVQLTLYNVMAVVVSIIGGFFSEKNIRNFMLMMVPIILIVLVIIKWKGRDKNEYI